MNSAARAVATWFGCGLFPWAPGTVGSAAAIIIAFLLHVYAGFFGWHIAVLGLAASLPGAWASDVEARLRGRKDPGQVVVDEVVGQWLAIGGAVSLNWKSWLAAFLLFRLFDIWKPFPARQLEMLPGGVGIMADDIMAGIYAAVVLLVAGWLNLY